MRFGAPVGRRCVFGAGGASLVVTGNPPSAPSEESVMRSLFMVPFALLLVVSSTASAQSPPRPRPLSPDGSAQTQVLGKWVKPPQPAWTMGREVYREGKWIEITSGRPL